MQDSATVARYAHTGDKTIKKGNRAITTEVKKAVTDFWRGGGAMFGMGHTRGSRETAIILSPDLCGGHKK